VNREMCDVRREGSHVRREVCDVRRKERYGEVVILGGVV
jgi:hypothetical protein